MAGRLARCGGRVGQAQRQFSSANQALKPSFFGAVADQGPGIEYFSGADGHDFPLPGNSAPLHQFQLKQAQNKLGGLVAEPWSGQTDVLTGSTPENHQLDALSSMVPLGPQPLQPSSPIHADVHECPQLLKKDFADLFPGRTPEGNLTVVTLTQQTTHEQTAWTEPMEAERDLLTVNLIETASEMCSRLNAAGFWADFIDPSSGRPYLGPFTNATLFETDERYRNLGFQIEDLGCCKVISHIRFGTRAMVGTLFTDAPADRPELLGLLKELTPA